MLTACGYSARGVDTSSVPVSSQTSCHYFTCNLWLKKFVDTSRPPVFWDRHGGREDASVGGWSFEEVMRQFSISWISVRISCLNYTSQSCPEIQNDAQNTDLAS